MFALLVYLSAEEVYMPAAEFSAVLLVAIAGRGRRLRP